jgi:tryptophan-rich sensory protein
MDLSLFAVFFVACATAGSTGAMFQPGDWYEQLKRPSWTPPNWLFPIAWTILYIAMAYAASRVAGAEGVTVRQVGLALGLWATQIALNTLWSPVFFGLKRLDIAMLFIVFLWLAVAATMLAFFAIDLIAGLIFVPYLLWCSYAGALNFWIWRANRAG